MSTLRHLHLPLLVAPLVLMQSCATPTPRGGVCDYGDWFLAQERKQGFEATVRELAQRLESDEAPAAALPALSHLRAGPPPPDLETIAESDAAVERLLAALREALAHG